MGLGRRNGWMRGALGAGLAAVLLVASAACGGGGDDDSSGGTTTIRFAWWGSADRAKLTQKAIDLFEQKNPNIKVETSFSAFAPYFEKLATQVAGNDAPDVFQMDRAYLREYADRGTLLDLGTRKDLRTDQLVSELQGSGEIDGKLYALPMGQNTHVIVYDEAAFSKAGVAAPKAGWTWEQMFTGAQKLTSASGGKVSGITDLGWSWEVFELWLRQHGKELYTDDGKLAFDENDLKTYLELLKKFRDGKAATPATVTSQIDGAIENMPMGKKLASSEFSWDSTIASYYSVLGKPVSLVQFPTDTGELGQYAKPSMYLSISKRTKKVDASTKLVDFLLNDVDAGKTLGVNRGLPPMKNVRDEVAKNLTGANKAVYEYESTLAGLEKAPTPPPKGNSTLKTFWQQLNEDVAFGKTSVDKAVSQFFSRAEQELS